MNNILEINNISKVFKNYTNEWQRVFSWFGLKIKPIEEHHILKHINFSIVAGEAIGIIGQNGAGKSTLLKIIAGTLKPTAGNIQFNGRISAILELGMGFHPDLTGRQNAYHAAGMMGFTPSEIDAVIEDIEQFAEIGEYFDQPVRTYSSGMQMRVSFGVATMYRPEILIVDEALSVGDSYFQHKSFDRIRQFQQQGTTLLIVSHDKAAIQAICSRAILLEKGTVIKDGNPETVMDFYNALIAEKENSTINQIEKEHGKVQTVSGTGEATIENVAIYNNGQQVEFIDVGEQITLKIKLKTNQAIEKLVVGYLIKDRLGQDIFGTNTHQQGKIINNAKANQTYQIAFTFAMNLGIGSYSIAIALHAHETHVTANYQWLDHAIVFNIINTSKKEFIGTSWLKQDIKVEHVN